MKRLLICASCAVSMVAVAVAVVMAIGVELAQKAKPPAPPVRPLPSDGRLFREALAQ